MTERVTLRSRLSRTLVGLGLVSVVLLAGANFFVVRGLLDETTNTQLVAVGDLRRDAFESGVERLLGRVSGLGGDPGVANALQQFSAGYDDLGDGDLDDDELADLLATYADVLARYDDAGVDRPATEDLAPTSAEGRSLQYLVRVAGLDEDAVEGSEEYLDANARFGPFLERLTRSIGATDLLLIDLERLEVVYSVGGNIDLGVGVTGAVYSDSALGRVVADLGDASADGAVIGDSEYYLPDSATPVLHVATSVRDETTVVGALVIQIPIDVVTALISANGDWDSLGLGDTGDAYIVGRDQRLRTVPRAWSDDPEGYVDRYLDRGGDERIAALMEVTGSPVLLHEVDGRAVELALEGERFVGRVDNPLGRAAITASEPLDVEGLDWVVITEQQTSETRTELIRFLVTIGLLLLVLLPVLAIVGLWLARLFARPVPELVAAAGRIAAGDIDSDVPDPGRNELGDVADQLRAVAAQLREQEAALVAEEDRISAMLGSVLPPDLVERVRDGERDLFDRADDGTVIALRLRGVPEAAGPDQDEVLDMTEDLLDRFGEVAADHGVERIRLASEQQLFVAGRGTPTAGAEVAVRFAVDCVRAVGDVADQFGASLSLHIGARPARSRPV